MSHRERGKDGPVADSVADSSTIVLFGMHLCTRGESEQDNIDKVMERMPSLTNHEHSVDSTFDRGYGKQASIKTHTAKRYNILTFAASSGSEHPYLTQDEVDKKMSDWRKAKKPAGFITNACSLIEEFILPDDENQGIILRIAKKDFEYQKGKSCDLYAIYLHDT